MAAETQTESLSQGAGIAAHFAISDFDGDQRPDLAVVQVDRYSSPLSSYSIHLRFSTAPDSAIGLVAPSGGLRISSRDVNGDDICDLVVTAALDSHLVAVLVNDGHGNFSVAAPGAYPDLENEPQLAFRGPAGSVADQTTFASVRSSFGEEGVRNYDYHTILSADAFPLTKDQTVPRRVAHSRLGRSPPALVALS